MSKFSFAKLFQISSTSSEKSKKSKSGNGTILPTKASSTAAALATTTKEHQEKNNENNKDAIIRLEDYDISPKTGFMPSSPYPIFKLPDAYYAPWEHIIENFGGLLLSGKFRSFVQRLPVLELDLLKTRREQERAYTILSLIAHAYIWGKNEDVCEILPKCIAKPWVKVSKQLGLPPVVTYAAVELYNYRLLEPEGPFNLDNLSMINTFTGSLDEAWFYLVSIGIEAAGAPLLTRMVTMLQYIRDNHVDGLTKELHNMKLVIDELTKILARMYEHNDPYIFFNRVRTYVAGWENMDKLPNGVFYEGCAEEEFDVDSEDEDEDCDASPVTVSPSSSKPTKTTFATHPQTKSQGSFKKFAGASAGQSTLIHALDTFLGIRHSGRAEGQHHPLGSLLHLKGVGSNKNVAGESTTSSTPVSANSEDTPKITTTTTTTTLGQSRSSSNESLNGQMNTPMAHTEASSPVLPATTNGVPVPPPLVSTDLGRDADDKEPSPDPQPPRKNFIKEMRRYMPRAHRHFLRRLRTSQYQIRNFMITKQELLETIQDNQENKDTIRQLRDCIEAYNDCVWAMKKFRDKHLQLVSVYIIVQAKKRKAEIATAKSSSTTSSSSAAAVAASAAGYKENKTGESLLARGTGGTDVVPLLKFLRGETVQAIVRDDK